MTPTETLKRAIESQHACKATFKEMAFVRDVFEGQTAWEGDVAVFDLEGHPTAKVAYAWADPIPGTNRARIFAVIQAGPVKTPLDAVRAALLQRVGDLSGNPQ